MKKRIVWPRKWYDRLEKRTVELISRPFYFEKDMPAWNKGVHHKHSGSFKSGSLHWNWKGGREQSPKHILKKSLEYKKWREDVFTRDKYTCQGCGKRGGYLHPHHIKPFSLFPELALDLSNGQTLCPSCHRQTTSYGVNVNSLKREDFILGIIE